MPIKFLVFFLGGGGWFFFGGGVEVPVLWAWGFFRNKKNKGEVFLLTVGAFLLTVKLLRLLKALIRRTFPL